MSVLVYPVPATIKADCSVDVTQQLNAWIASVPNGSVLSFANGCYRVDGTILVENRQNLTFEGNGARLKAFVTPYVAPDKRSGRKHLRFLSSSNLIIRNLRIEGTNTIVERTRRDLQFTQYLAQYESEHGLTFNNSHNVLVDNVTVDAVFGDGLYVGTIPARSTNITVTNFTVSRNGRQGIAITWADNVLLDKVNVTNSRRSAIDLEPAAKNWQVTNVEIRNSKLASLFGALSAHGEGGVSRVYFHNNVILDAGKPWVTVQGTTTNRRQYWRIHNNNFSEIASAPIASFRFRRTDHVEVVGNLNRMNPDRERTAVLFDDAGGSLLVANNNFIGACYAYRTVNATTSVTAYNNVISDDCVYDVQPKPVKQPAPYPESNIRVWDSFSNTDGLNLQLHKPDIDKVGKGWQSLKMNPRSGHVPLAAIRRGQARILEPMSGFVVDAGITNGIVEVDWTPGAGLDYNAVILRNNPNATSHMVLVHLLNGDPAAGGEQKLNITKVNSKGKTLTSKNFPWVDGTSYRMRMELAGPTIKVFVNGILQLQVTDRDLDNGATQFGFARVRLSEHGDHFAAFDNFLVMANSNGALSPDDDSASPTPRLTLPMQNAILFGQGVAVAVDFEGDDVVSTNFSVEYDGSCLQLDPADRDGNGIPDAITLTLPDGVLGSVALAGDQRVEFEINAPPTAYTPLPEGALATIHFATICNPGLREPQLGSLRFGEPFPVFRNDQGLAVSGSAEDGFIEIVYAVRPGDANQDGKVDWEDIEVIISEIFDGDGNFWLDAPGGKVVTDPVGADVNEDQIIDAGDLICTLHHIAGNGDLCTGLNRNANTPLLHMEQLAARSADAQLVFPIQLGVSGGAVATAFAIDLNSAFQFDPKDDDGNGIPDAVTFHISGDFETRVEYDHTAQRLNFLIADLNLPFSSLPTGTLATITLQVAGETDEALSTISLPFSVEVIASLSDASGQSIPVNTENGTLQPDGYLPEKAHKLMLPALFR